MKPTQKLHDLGQSLWLNNITRDLVNSGKLRQYRDEAKDLYARVNRLKLMNHSGTTTGHGTMLSKDFQS